MTAPFVLLVDDEVSFVKTMAKRLDKRNIRTLQAHSGEEALEQLQKHPYLDVVVLDVKMPGMDGIETLRQIKQASPVTAVIMLSGHATVDSAIDGMKLGAYDYLTKPCDIDQLVGKLEEVTRKKRAHENRMHDWESFMESSSLEELMVPLAEYATVSEDANILEAYNALGEAQKAFDPKRYRHRAVLALNKEGRVVGKLSQHDLLEALEPGIKESKERKQGAASQFGFSQKFIESVSLQYDFWGRPLENLYKKALEQKVKSVMYTPTEGEYIEVSANMNETIHRLIVGKHHSLLVTDGPDIVGIVRLTDVFEFIRLRLNTMQHAAADTSDESRQT